MPIQNTTISKPVWYVSISGSVLEFSAWQNQFGKYY